MNEQTLELQIQSKAQSALSNVDSLISKLTSLERTVSSIDSKLKTGSVNNANSNVNQLKNTIDKTTSSTDKLGRALKSVFTFTGVKRLTTTLLGWMNEAIDYTEQLNLFNVVFDNVEKNGVQTFSKLGKEATQFQYKLNEAFGTNKTQTLYTQGIFQSMGETVGIDDAHSAIMSETMTKLTYDLASLYNKTETATAEAIRAGVYAGQTKPLRNYGIDVTQMSMQPILDSLGIDKQVKEMSQAEKEILRYLATMKQAQIAMGDLANTIESPSNQLKVFRQQLIEAKVALSSLFVGGLSSILPYANAILMVVKEVSKAIASMFGIKLKDYNSGIASTNKYSDSLGGVGSSADKAGKKVKELKRQVLGFDEIHNIDENKNSGSGSSGSGGTSGGIDQRLLDAIKGYDNGMEKVKMKATQIRDKIMEWLGFHKKINPLTGEVYFEYQGIKKTLQNMWKSFKGLSTEGKILVGLGLVAGAIKLWNTGKKLVTIFGNSGLGKIIKGLISPSRELINWGILGVKTNGNLISGLRDGIQAWRASNGIIEESTGKVKGFSGVMSGAKIAVQGLITGAVGLYTVNKSMQSLSTDGANLANVLGLVTGSLTTIASGVQIGAIFGPWGAVIGGATGALLLLINALDEYKSSSSDVISKIKDTNTEVNKFTESMISQYNSISETYATDTALQTYYENLLNELSGLVDANGKVKAGYEERAEFIVTTLNSAYGTEIEMTDGIIKNYDNQVKSIKTLIDEKKKEIALQMAEEKYKVAIDNKTESYKKLEKAQKNYADAEKAYNERLEAALKVYNNMSEKKKEHIKSIYGSIEAYAKQQVAITSVGKTYKNAEKTLDDAKEVYKTNTEAIMSYQGLLTADTQKDSKLIQQYINEIGNSYVENGKVIKQNYTDQIKDAQLYYDEYISLSKKNNIEITDDVKAFASERYNAVINGLMEETKAIGKDGKVSKDLAKAWYTLGITNKDKFLENFGSLPKEIQQKVVDKMYDKGYNISSELQNGIKQINPEIKIKTKTENATVKIDADTSQAKKKTDSWLKDVLKKMGGAFGLSIGGGFRANGGIYSNGSWKNIPQYANGGAPSHGTMFVAGESGAEIVGHINGKTEVLNQSQIASAIYSATLSAMSQVMNSYGSQYNEIDVHVHTDEGTVVDRINQKTKQTGVCPINIPV